MKYAILLGLIALSFVGGWHVRDLKAQRDDQQQEAAALRAQQQARQREQHLQQQMEHIQHETQQQLAEISAIERAAADKRVRELAQNYAAGANRSHSPVAARCQTERIRAAVLTELLTELDELAAVFALEADRRKIAGLACENAYQAIRFP